MCEAVEVKEVIYRFDDLSENLRFSWEESFSLEDTRLFSNLSGDRNSIHLSHEAATKRGFQGPVVHAARVLGEISRACGFEFFASGVVASNLEAQFCRPVLHDTKYNFILVCESLCQTRAKKEATFRFEISDHNKKSYVTGKVRLCFP